MKSKNWKLLLYGILIVSILGGVTVYFMETKKASGSWYYFSEYDIEVLGIEDIGAGRWLFHFNREIGDSGWNKFKEASENYVGRGEKNRVSVLEININIVLFISFVQYTGTIILSEVILILQLQVDKNRNLPNQKNLNTPTPASTSLTN